MIHKSELSRRGFIASGAAPLMAQSVERPTQPNIVFVLVDDLRFDGLGCTGHPFAKTPNIDRIAREGANFDKFFCVTLRVHPAA